MPNVALPPNGKYQVFDANGDPIVGAKLYTYLAGTSTPQATYTDYTGAVAAANPLISDSRGEIEIWIDRSIAYKFTLTDASDVLIWTVDQVNYAGVSGTSQTFAAGSAAAPSVNFVGALTSGMYSPGANQVGISTNGASAIQIDSSQNVGLGGAASTKLDVYGTTKVRGTLTITTGGFSATGTATIVGAVTITGATSITGALTVAGGIFSSRGFVDNATVPSWNIDSSGRLLNNGTNQPSFAAYRATSQQASGTTLIMNTEQFDRGGNYNNATGVFTAPVAGVYSFSASAELTNSTGANVAGQLLINCSTAGSVASSSFTYATGTIFSVSTSVVVYLVASETVQAVLNTSLSATFVLNTVAYSRFSGVLLH
jgi:hypothetical protein